jgi:hypothetical protein
MAKVPQLYENHRLSVPLYYYVLSSILAVNLLWSVLRVIHAVWQRSGWYELIDSLVALLLAAGLAIIFMYLRVWPLRVLDRLIRLEMQWRLQRLLPDDLRPRIPELTLNQLIALRFASDEELPELCHRVLVEDIRQRDAIKRLIRTWKADQLRI